MCFEKLTKPGLHLKSDTLKVGVFLMNANKCSRKVCACGVFFPPAPKAPGPLPSSAFLSADCVRRAVGPAHRSKACQPSLKRRKPGSHKYGIQNSEEADSVCERPGHCQARFGSVAPILIDRERHSRVFSARVCAAREQPALSLRAD